ncbi:MAG: AEC family transporter [Candidatus Heimdallarchaeota archaeon]|nr:AEC family transporter [Candidatus Heimdallarchaeota archaeon]
MAALFLGLLLDFSGVKRPQIVGTVSRNLIYLDVALYTFAIGLTVRVRKIVKYLREDLSLSVLKFVLSPLIAVGIAYLLGCHRILGGLPLKVVFIESCMPVAIFSLVLSRLLDLNQDLANSAWIFTTFAVLPLIPLIYFVMRLL